MAEHQLPKLTVRVRFPSSAPTESLAADPSAHALIGSRIMCNAELGMWRSDRKRRESLSG